MGYVVAEIAAFLLVALLLGILVGWLLFRAGRRTVSFEEWERLEQERQQVRSERDLALSDKDLLLADRDRAFAERDSVLDARNRLEVEHREAMSELIDLRAERTQHPTA